MKAKAPTKQELEEQARLARNEAQNERRKQRRLEKREERALERAEAKEAARLAKKLKPAADLPMPDFSEEGIKKMFGQAFARMGGTEGLVLWGAKYPKEFYAMWARYCLPKPTADNAPVGGTLEDMLSQLDGSSVQ